MLSYVLNVDLMLMFEQDKGGWGQDFKILQYCKRTKVEKLENFHFFTFFFFEEKQNFGKILMERIYKMIGRIIHCLDDNFDQGNWKQRGG